MCFPLSCCSFEPLLLGRSTEEKKAAESLDDQAAVKTMKQRVAEVGGAGGAAGKSPTRNEGFYMLYLIKTRNKVH